MDARDTYIRRKEDIGALLDWISMELDEHAAHAEREGGPDWADAGDLAHVRNRLIETLAFVAQQDEDFVKEALADAAAGREQAARKTSD